EGVEDAVNRQPLVVGGEDRQVAVDIDAGVVQRLQGPDERADEQRREAGDEERERGPLLGMREHRPGARDRDGSRGHWWPPLVGIRSLTEVPSWSCRPAAS